MARQSKLFGRFLVVAALGASLLPAVASADVAPQVAPPYACIYPTGATGFSSCAPAGQTASVTPGGPIEVAGVQVAGAEAVGPDAMLTCVFQDPSDRLQSCSFAGTAVTAASPSGAGVEVAGVQVAGAQATNFDAKVSCTFPAGGGAQVCALR